MAVAATPARSELNDEAKLERAADASLVMDAVSVAVGLPLAPEITDEAAEETALERSEAAEETTPDTPAPVPAAAAAEVPVEPCESVRMGMGRPPVPRSPPLDEAPVDEALVESSDGPVRIGIGRPPVPRIPAVGEAPVAPSDNPVRIGIARPPVPRMPAFDEDPVLLVAMTPSAVAVVDPELTVPFAVADEASFTVAEGLADAVPSMMVDNPTVIAPRLDEPDASDALELLSREAGPVGDGSADGANPVEPTSGEGERVERISVSVAVGETA